MPRFSQKSIDQLNSCHIDLKNVMFEAIKGFDIIILEGYRDKEGQDAAVAKGLSKVNWPNGKHNSIPSMALDCAPYPVNWKDTSRFILMAGYVLGIADQMKREGRIKHSLRWGGDWSMDMDMRNERFLDYGHFELK